MAFLLVRALSSICPDSIALIAVITFVILGIGFRSCALFSNRTRPLFWSINIALFPDTSGLACPIVGNKKNQPSWHMQINKKIRYMKGAHLSDRQLSRIY